MESIFSYIYAVLHSAAFRKKYAEFLKVNFPRIPFAGDSSLFYELADKGEELASLHMLRNVWEYHVGGYRVAEKWLKDSKGRTLSSEDVSHYCKVLTALAETIEVQKSLDVLFKWVERTPLKAESRFA